MAENQGKENQGAGQEVPPQGAGAARVGNGGSAFPHQGSAVLNADGSGVTLTPNSSGMTLRDYFAAKALQGYIVVGVSRFNPNAVIDAYRYADAMIMVRTEGGAP